MSLVPEVFVITDSPIPMLDLQPQLDALWPELEAATARVLRSGVFIGGPEVKAFEEEAARYLGTKHAVGLNSGTDALVIGLRAFGVGPGDEVITTPFSFFASAEAISNVGATPVFADVDERSFNIDPTLLEAAITPKTKAIMPVHLYGNPAPMTELLDIAERHGFLVLEDGAQSFGARYRGDCSGCNAQCKEARRTELTGRFTGTLGHAGAFSFYPTKNLGAYGDGGLLVTADDAVAEAARKLRNHGSAQRYHNEMLGYNSRLDALQAAILRVKLPYLDAWNAARRAAAAGYGELLAGLEGVILPDVPQGHVVHQYTVRVLKGRDRVQAMLKQAGISSIVYYPSPQSELPVYAGQYPRYPVAERLSREALSLPIWPEITEATQVRVAEALRQALKAR